MNAQTAPQARTDKGGSAQAQLELPWRPRCSRPPIAVFTSDRSECSTGPKYAKKANEAPAATIPLSHLLAFKRLLYLGREAKKAKSYAPTSAHQKRPSGSLRRRLENQWRRP